MTKPRQGLTVSDTLTDEETTVFLEMMRAGGHSTPAGALRTALYNYARHLGIDCPAHLFKLTGTKR